MDDLSALSRLLADLHEPRQDEDQTLRSILRFACHALRCEHAGVLLVHPGGRVETAAASDPVVVLSDELQMDFQEGPCLSALAAAHVELIPITADEPRWPSWAHAAHVIGIRSVLSVRLAREDTDPIGSLNMYNETTHGFDASDLPIAQLLARHASLALARTAKRVALRVQLDTHATNGQAEGILMQRYGIDADQAATLLRRCSQERDLLLPDIAQQVVQERGLPGPLDGNDQRSAPR